MYGKTSSFSSRRKVASLKSCSRAPWIRSIRREKKKGPCRKSILHGNKTPSERAAPLPFPFKKQSAGRKEDRLAGPGKGRGCYRTGASGEELVFIEEGFRSHPAWREDILRDGECPEAIRCGCDRPAPDIFSLLQKRRHLQDSAADQP